MPEIKITHDTTMRTHKVDHVYQVKRGEEGKALDAMKRDGADNIVFKGDDGDLYIASRVGLPRNVRINDRVEIEGKGVRGTVWGFDNEANTWSEVLTTHAARGAAAGGAVGLGGVAAAMLKGGIAFSPLVALGLVAGAGLIGFAVSLLWKAKPNYDLLDPHTNVEYAQAPVKDTKLV